MPKNVVIVTSSLRKNSNSDALAQAFARGAREAGHTVEMISLKGKSISFCQGCLACQRTGHCVISDDAVASFPLAQPAQTRINTGLFKKSKDN